MVEAIMAAQLAARKAIESTYCDKATVMQYERVIDKKSKLAKPNGCVAVLEDEPCKLSFESITQTVQTESKAKITQAVKLFISPDVIISPGSKITVMHGGENNGLCVQWFPGGICDTSGNYVGIMGRESLGNVRDGKF